jgi:hypothetical protein
MQTKPTERRIKSTGHGMARYGACERCGKFCDMTYKQQYRAEGAANWICCGFGHIACLRGGAWDQAPVEHSA